MSDSESPPSDESPTRSVPPSGSPPQRIGPYRILESLGEGGMGEVFLAEQEYPIRRRVALKIIKLGMDTKEVIGRFESERQALAIMNHPSVAKVFDAGATEQGRPYFVMEHVPGVPITDYCDRHRLSTRERLELFIPVCQAIHHAHQKGIIHRDIKPTNVLVAVQDGKPVPKVIDFGVAKAIEKRLTERTVYTEQGRLIGTPAYMSPEQAEMTGLNIDTTTDVYSLGVLLYELLVGALPFDPHELLDVGLEAMHRIIREVDPPTPSSRISTLGETATDIAAHRRTIPDALVRQVRGELDWITLRAMEKDRTRRYPSASELASDVARYLNDEPVLARPPTTAYRAAKFVRRHRSAVTIAAAFVSLLIGFTVVVTYQATRIARERDRAAQEAMTANQVSDFLMDLFEVSDPSVARGNSITAREILDRGAEKIDRMLTDQPRVRARLMATIGDVYERLGLSEPAIHLMEDAVAAQRQALGENDEETLYSLDRLAHFYYRQGRLKEAEAMHLQVLDARRRDLGETHPRTLGTMGALALVYMEQDRHAEAETLLVRVLDARQKDLGEADGRTISAMNHLAHAYRDQQRYEEARPLFLRAVDLARESLGDDHPETLHYIHDLAILYTYQGQFSEAESLLVEALEGRRRVMGEDHPETLKSMHSLAAVYAEQGRSEAAEQLALETLNKARQAPGGPSSELLDVLTSIAHICKDQGDYPRAEALYREVLDTRPQVSGTDYRYRSHPMKDLAHVYFLQGRYEEAEMLGRDALAIERRVLGDDHLDTVMSLVFLAGLLALEDRKEEALFYLDEAMEHETVVEEFLLQHSAQDLAMLDQPEFRWLRDDPRFGAILTRVREQITAE